MDRINYYDEYFLDNIDFDTLMEKVQESIEDNVAYTMGAIDCVKFMYNYYNGTEPIYPSEMAAILDKFLESIGLSEELRKDITLEEASCYDCSGCVYENLDGATPDIGVCVSCRRNNDIARNDYYINRANT